MPKEYYEILGVSEDASQDEIKQAYRKKAKKYHPDSGSEYADEETFKEINKAYDVLSDEEKRKKYDRFGKAGVDAQSRPGGGQGFGGLGDLFEHLFGGMGGGRGRGRERGQHLKIPVTVTLEEAYGGVEKTFKVERRKQCDDCNGSGGDGGNTTTCSNCNGQGRVQAVQRTPFGRARTVKECDECRGRGQIPESTCSTCNGEGVRAVEETLSIDIPAGAENGERLRLRGKGHETRNGDAGNLYVFVDVDEHPDLERREDDLFTTVRVGVGDAALGGTVKVPTPDGSVQVTVPEGTQPGQVLRVEGKGMPTGSTFGSSYGDLYVKVDVHIPQELDDDQKAVFESLKEQPENEKSFFETVKDIVS